jgi:hypothetical protein
MSRDTKKAAVDPSFSDNLRYGAARGHVQPRYANLVGMPRGYGFGASMTVWVIDYLANWASDWGFVRHHKSQYRYPALTGNVTYVSGEVTNKWVDEYFDHAVVEITYQMVTQTGTLLAKGVGEVELPQSEDDASTILQDPRVRRRLQG